MYTVGKKNKYIYRKLAFAIGAVTLISLLALALILFKKTVTTRTLTRADLPLGAIFMPHVHEHEDIHYDDAGQPIGVMEHYATPGALKNGGPIYGVYSYAIVSVEYKIPESKIGNHAVGKEYPGWGLAPSFFGLVNDIPPYDHFHIGIEDEGKNSTTTEKTYLIHFMLLPHSEELRLGLNCG